MKKKIYQRPYTEQTKIQTDCSLLVFWSAPWVEGSGEVEPEAKRNTFDEFDFLEDEDIEPVWSFNVWED